MLDFVDIAVLIMGATICVACIWGLYCNNKTYSERGKIIDQVFRDGSNWRVRHLWLEEVSYDAHFCHRVTFRDPHKLYDQRLFDKEV